MCLFTSCLLPEVSSSLSPENTSSRASQQTEKAIEPQQGSTTMDASAALGDRSASGTSAFVTGGVGSPRPQVCVPKSLSCERSMLNLCSDDGLVVTTTTCAEGCDRTRAACLSCPAESHGCSGECFPATDAQHCGPTCRECPSEIAHGQSACVAGICDAVCESSSLRCVSEMPACAALRYGFDRVEDGKVFEGSYWHTTIASEHTHGGSGAARIEMMLDAYSSATGSLVIRLCGLSPPADAHIDVSGRALSAWLFVETRAEISDSACALEANTTLATAPTISSPGVDVKVGEWMHVHTDPLPAGTGIATLIVSCNLYFPGGKPEVAPRIYADDLSIE